ncbi:MAG: DUF1444 family protein [Verrucomicrobiota bacterium]
MKRIIKPLLAILGLGACNPEVELLSANQFTGLFVREFKSAQPDADIEVKNELELNVNIEGSQPFTIFLNNAYDLYKQDPKDLAGVIKKYVESAKESLDKMSELLNASQILPVVKDTQWLGEIHQVMRERSDKTPPDYLREALAPGLEVFYVQDTPKSIRYLTEADFVSAGIELAGLRQLACANLQKLMASLQVHDGNDVSMITLDGNYESSLLLFNDIWAQMKAKVSGGVVVALPTRDVLLFTGSEDEAGLKKIREMAQRAFEGSYRLTQQLYIFRNGSFELFSKR